MFFFFFLRATSTILLFLLQSKKTQQKQKQKRKNMHFLLALSIIAFMAVPETLFKKKPHRRCFPVNPATSFGAKFLKNISGRRIL